MERVAKVRIKLKKKVILLHTTLTPGEWDMQLKIRACNMSTYPYDNGYYQNMKEACSHKGPWSSQYISYVACEASPEWCEFGILRLIFRVLQLILYKLSH